jgi:BCD family chlorophyll transporter-like MFS transporter
MLRKRFQLALIHLAVAMTLVPINSTLNRIMIKEMAISATLVAILASLPYLFSPTQVLIGSYSDRHPLFGWRRTPYIAMGLGLCVLGVIFSPLAVFLMPVNPWLGLLVSLLVFAAWGMGFNIASVSYLSLASELSGEGGRSRTVSVMWFVMIAGIIVTAATLSALLADYSHAALQRAFLIVGLSALGLGLLGLFRLEPRFRESLPPGKIPQRANWQVLMAEVLGNPEARSFFIYLILLLAAILGQDVLLEPFAGEAFHLPVQATTRITSIWGTCVLVTLIIAGILEKRIGKRAVAQMGAAGAILGFVVIAASGLAGAKSIFYAGVVLLGLGTGLATVSNLSLMLDMTTARVGLFIGAWGVADALARLVGTVLAGAVRDVVAQISGNAITGYVSVFAIQAGLLVISWILLMRIDVGRFQAQTISLEERAALMEEA